DDEIERPRAGVRTFRTDGERVHVIQLRFARASLRVPIGLEHGVLALPDACWSAAAALLERAPQGDTAALARLLDAFAAAGTIDAGLSATLCADEPERFRRLWAALEPLFATYKGTTSLKQVASETGMSLRQMGRDAKELSRAFGYASGYRDSF